MVVAALASGCAVLLGGCARGGESDQDGSFNDLGNRGKLRRWSRLHVETAVYGTAHIHRRAHVGEAAEHHGQSYGTADDEICGVKISKGTAVGITPWVLHRHRRLWDDPERFDPERCDHRAVELRWRFRTSLHAQHPVIESLAILRRAEREFRPFFPDAYLHPRLPRRAFSGSTERHTVGRKVWHV